MGSHDEKALAHAWAYFELHAAQRITVFNYFVVFSGILATGLAATLQAAPRLASVGVALGLLLTLLSYLFWQLDRRTAFLVKHAEEAIATLEPDGARLVGEEAARSTAAANSEGLWTYKQVFRVIFLVMALVGLAGAAVCALRWGGQLNWIDDAPIPEGSAAPADRAADPGARLEMGSPPLRTRQTSSSGDQEGANRLARPVQGD